MSNAGKKDKNDPRNLLITYVIDFIKKVEPENIIIENVPQILKTTINIDNKNILIKDYIIDELKKLNYFINYDVLNSAHYNTAQTRNRAIFLISKIKKWEFPKKANTQIIVRDVIGDLPSLESGEKSNIKYHYSKIHNNREILWLKHTPTGCSAFDNAVYYPQKENGQKIKGWHSTYSRIYWDKPAPTITMSNGSLGSQSNGHPGRLLEDGTYSDTRALTILELLRLTGLPDNWNIPDWATDNFIRQVIGECFPPKFASALLTTMPKNE